MKERIADFVKNTHEEIAMGIIRLPKGTNVFFIDKDQKEPAQGTIVGKTDTGYKVLYNNKEVDVKCEDIVTTMDQFSKRIYDDETPFARIEGKNKNLLANGVLRVCPEITDEEQDHLIEAIDNSDFKDLMYFTKSVEQFDDVKNLIYTFENQGIHYYLIGVK